jgi:putative ABC transport system ATP-binding protein
MTLFETRNLCKYYRRGSDTEVRAIDDVSITVERGSFSVLTGPSGSGKTTLLALLGALERPTRGQVIFEARNLADFSDVELARVRRRMGVVFQNFSLIPKLSVWDNVTYPLIPRGIARAERYGIAQAILSRLAMLDKISKRPEQLRGGEQQRVAVARALAGEPTVLLADEPTSNLDPRAARALASLLRQIHSEGKTVLVASHDPEIVSLATQVYELDQGRLKAF